MSGASSGWARGAAGGADPDTSDEEWSASEAAASSAGAGSDYQPAGADCLQLQESQKRRRKVPSGRRREERETRAALPGPRRRTRHSEASQHKLDQALKQVFEEKYKNECLSNELKRKSWSASEASGNSAAPRDPPDEFVQVSITRVFESMENSAKLSAVLTQAARAAPAPARGSAPAAARGSGDAAADAWAGILDLFTAGAPAQYTCVDFAPCREGESPMQHFRFQDERGVADEQALQAALAEHEAASGEWAAARAELAACAGALQHARARLRGAPAPAPGDRRLRRALDELEQCAQEYADALKDIS